MGRIFFEKMANTHRRYDDIDKLLIDGIEAEDPDTIKVKILKYYKNMSHEAESWNPDMMAKIWVNFQNQTGNGCRDA